MTQITHDCNGPGLPDYPGSTIKPLDVTVWMHDSGMLATHNYACPVCREESAILMLHNGLMQPCYKCRAKGYEVVKFDNRLSSKLFKWLENKGW